MRQPAHLARLTPAAIYAHFRNKSELLRELVVEHDFRAFSARFARLAAIPDPVERLRELGHSYTDSGIAYPNRYPPPFMTPHGTSVATAGNRPAALSSGMPDQDAYTFLKATIQECIDTERLRPEYRNADEVAQIIWAALLGVVALHIAKGGHRGSPGNPPRAP
jgi:AcrR family transcriptional regulator